MAKHNKTVCFKADKGFGRCIRNGTTTVVYGNLEIKAKGEVRDNLADLTSRCIAFGSGFGGDFRGIAKLHPEDTYDEVMGKAVAASKAEAKALKAARKKVVSLIDALETTKNDMEREIGFIDNRLRALESNKK